MPTYEVDYGGKTYEVDAPDPKTAWSYAAFSASQAPKVAEPGLPSIGPQPVAPTPISQRAPNVLDAQEYRSEEHTSELQSH